MDNVLTHNALQLTLLSGILEAGTRCTARLLNFQFLQ